MKIEYLQEAILEGEKARGLSSPNPFVGAIIVNNNQIVGRGHTQKHGSNHAEIEALMMAGTKAVGADLYVTLEPCCHLGKTPPCTDAIIKAGIKRVFIGIADPNPLVSLQGILQLQDAGLEVQYGYMEKQISRQLEAFLFSIQHKRPFVTAKHAITIDGKTASDKGDSKWITNNLSRERVHHLRNEMDAVLTGIGTIIADDPLYTVRIDSPIPKSTTRVILDTYLRIPDDSQIVKTAPLHKTIIYCSSELTDNDKCHSLQNKGIEIRTVSTNSNHIVLKEVLADLYSIGIGTVLLEAGQTLNSAFLKEKLINKFYFFIAPKIVGGTISVYQDLAIDLMSNAINLEFAAFEKIDNNLLITAYPEK